MASRTIIIDSDDDDGEVLSASQSPNKLDVPEISAAKDDANIGSVQKSDSSTDPLVFQQLYEANLASLDATSNSLQHSMPSPAMEDLVRVQAPRTSSSPTSVNKLKRSKTVNLSSLTSISEPTKSSKSTRRRKSTTNVEDLTQITTPGRGKDSSDKNHVHRQDIWEFPSSLSSEMGKAVRVPSRNAEKEKKTYGKQKLQRSKTLEARSQGYSDAKNPVSSTDDSSLRYLGSTLQRSKSSVQSPVLPNVKSVEFKNNTGSHSAGGDGGIAADAWKSSSLGASRESINFTSTSGMPASVQVPHSTGTETWQIIKPSIRIGHDNSDLQARNGSNLSFEETGNSADQDSKLSIMIPNTLTSSQKLNYEAIEAHSTPPSAHSQPGTLDTIRYSVPSDVLNLLVATSSKATPAHTASTNANGYSSQYGEDPQSSPIITTDRKAKRARSFSVVDEHPTSQASNLSNGGKRLRRNASTGHKVTLSASQHSMDELSLPETRSARARDLATNPVKESKRKRSQAHRDDRVQIDELFDSDDLGFSKEQYKPRPSRRRSNNSTQGSLDILEPAKTSKRVKRTKSLEAQSALKTQGTKATRAQSFTPGTCEMQSVQNHKFADVESVELQVPSERSGPKSALTEISHNDSLALLLQEGLEAPLAASDMEKRVQNTQMPLDGEEISPRVDSPAPKAKRGRPKKKPETNITGSILESTGSSVDTTGLMSKTVDIDDEHTPVVNKVSANLAPDRGQIPQHQGQEPAYADFMAAPSKGPARKRGRPRTKTMPVFSSERIYDEDDDSPVVISISKRKTSLIEPTPPPETPKLKEIVANQSQSPSLRSSTDVVTKQSPPQEVENENKNEASAIKEKQKEAVGSLETPVRGAAKGPDKHSPLTSSKVAYRVGLSKKRKIAPLLKIRPKSQA